MISYAFYVKNIEKTSLDQHEFARVRFVLVSFIVGWLVSLYIYFLISGGLGLVVSGGDLVSISDAQ